MKFISVLIFLIFNSILWSLINSVKNNKNQNEVAIVSETSKDLNNILLDGAESSVGPQNNKELLKLAEKKIKKKEYDNEYNQKNKEKRKEYYRKYQQKNKEKLKEKRNSENYKQVKKEYDRNYYKNNKEKILEYKRFYDQNNKDKRNDSRRKYREKKKNEMENLKNEISQLRNIHSEINEGTSFILPQNNASENSTKILNAGDESTVAAQCKKYQEKVKITSNNELKINENEKKLRKKEYDKERYQKNKEKMCENIENLRKSKLEILQNINSKLINSQSNNGNLLPTTQNNDCGSKEKELIVSKENIQLEKGEDNPIQSSHNVEGIENAEGTSFVNPQMGDFEGGGHEPSKENVQLDKENILLQDDNSIRSSYKDEGNSAHPVNPQKGESGDNSMNFPYEQGNVHIEHRNQQNDLNAVDYLNFLYDLNFLDNQNFL